MLERIKSFGAVLWSWGGALLSWSIVHLAQLQGALACASFAAATGFTLWQWRREAKKKD